jgi:CrcB protein
MVYLWVAIGGALGSMARFGMSGLIAGMTGGLYPYGTIFVNVTGALLIGFIATPIAAFLFPPTAASS